MPPTFVRIYKDPVVSTVVSAITYIGLLSVVYYSIITFMRQNLKRGSTPFLFNLLHYECWVLIIVINYCVRSSFGHWYPGGCFQINSCELQNAMQRFVWQIVLSVNKMSTDNRSWAGSGEAHHPLDNDASINCGVRSVERRLDWTVKFTNTRQYCFS